MNRCWTLFKWSLLLASVAGVLLAQYFYLRVDEEIRARVEGILAEGYPHLRVRVHSARLIDGQGIEVRRVTIHDPTLPTAYAELAAIDEVFLECTTDMRELVAGKLQVTQVRVSGPTVRMVRMTDGEWSWRRFYPPPQMPRSDGPPPSVRVENAVVQVLDMTRPDVRPLVFRDVAVEVTPETDAQGKHFRLVAGLTSEHLPRLRVEGVFDPERRTCLFQADATGLEVCPELLAGLPQPLDDLTACAKGLRGRVDAQCKASFDPTAAVPFQFEVQSRVYRGRADDPRLPFPMTEVEGTATISHEGLQLHQLQAKGGEALWELRGWKQGFTVDSPCSFRVTGRGAPIDERLYERLPEKTRRLWNEYSPRGKCDVTFDVVRDEHGWRPTGVIELVDFSASFVKFPYRVERIHGRVVVRDRTFLVDLHGMAGERPMRMTGHVVNPGPEVDLDLHIVGDRLVMEERMLRAMPPDASQVLREMHLQGSFNLKVDLRRQPGLNQPIDQLFRIELDRASLLYDKFPYPLSSIHGVVYGHGRVWSRNGETIGKVWNWSFEDLLGNHGATRVQGRGRIDPSPEGTRLTMELTGVNVALDDELRDALPARAKILYEQIRPQGFIDATCSVSHLQGGQPDITVDVKPLGASIEPVWFPYRIEKLQGTAVFEKNKFRLSGVRGQHGDVILAGEGFGEAEEDGRWRFRLDSLSVDRMRLERDRDLVQALPVKLRSSLASLRPSGPMSLAGSLEFAGQTGVEDSLVSGWNLRLSMQRCELDNSLKLSNMFGVVTMVGQANAVAVRARGEIELDALDFRGFQFTQIRGPITLDERRVVLGSDLPFDAPSDPSRPGAAGVRRMTAKVCGGAIVGDVVVQYGQSSDYFLQARLVDADLGRYAREMLPGRQRHLAGRVVGNLTLSGSGAHSLRGEGKLALREADIYELPVMVSLLSILSLKPPDNSAFTESDVDFRVVGDYIQFRQIDFRGDAVSLRGTGSMTTDMELELSFHAVVGRDNLRLPLVDKVIGRASQQLMEIQITGPVSDPQTTRRLVPGVQYMLNELQATPPSGGARPRRPGEPIAPRP